MAAPWFEDDIAAAVAPLLPGLAVEVVDEIDSTSSELMSCAVSNSDKRQAAANPGRSPVRSLIGSAWSRAIRTLFPRRKDQSIASTLPVPRIA